MKARAQIGPVKPKITGQTAWLLRHLRSFKVQADLDRLFLVIHQRDTSLVPTNELKGEEYREIPVIDFIPTASFALPSRSGKWPKTIRATMKRR